MLMLFILTNCKNVYLLKTLLCYHQHYNIIIINLTNITIINFTGRQRLDVGRVPSRDGPCWLCGGGQGGQAAGGDDGDEGGDGGDDEDAGDDVFSTTLN